MMTRLEQEALEEARHFIPEIAKQLLRIADNLEAFVKLAAEQVKED
jgi:molecular chaperone GrpE (heat shock protein)